jgi:predicted membrane GTPase involved in stress response
MKDTVHAYEVFIPSGRVQEHASIVVDRVRLTGYEDEVGSPKMLVSDEDLLGGNTPPVPLEDIIYE